SSARCRRCAPAASASCARLAVIRPSSGSFPTARKWPAPSRAATSKAGRTASRLNSGTSQIPVALKSVTPVSASAAAIAAIIGRLPMTGTTGAAPGAPSTRRSVEAKPASCAASISAGGSSSFIVTGARESRFMRSSYQSRRTAFLAAGEDESIMKRSSERFLTTHTGSLPRPADLVRMMFAKEEGVPVARDALQSRIAAAVEEIVAKQVAAGVDIVNDGELSKPSYATYIKDRLSGFGGSSNSFVYQDLVDFPELARRVFGDP